MSNAHQVLFFRSNLPALNTSVGYLRMLFSLIKPSQFLSLHVMQKHVNYTFSHVALVNQSDEVYGILTTADFGRFGLMFNKNFVIPVLPTKASSLNIVNVANKCNIDYLSLQLLYSSRVLYHFTANDSLEQQILPAGNPTLGITWKPTLELNKPIKSSHPASLRAISALKTIPIRWHQYYCVDPQTPKHDVLHQAAIGLSASLALRGASVDPQSLLAGDLQGTAAILGQDQLLADSLGNLVTYTI